MRTLTKTQIFRNLLKTSYRNFTTNEQTKGEEKKSENEEKFEKEENTDSEEYEEEQSFWQKYSRLILGGVITGGVATHYYLKKEESESGIYSKVRSYFNSTWMFQKINSGVDYVKNPPMVKFLPDEPPINKQMLRKTLVINFEGTMYAKDFKAGEGMVLHLRPGFRKFVKDMSPKYEIVIYTKEDTNFINEVVQTIDPFQTYLHWYFGNEFMVTKPSGLYKDLSFLNRDLDRVVVIDFDSDVYYNNKQNVIYLKEYRGEKDDKGLKEVSFFLNHLADPGIRDVRAEIRKFGGFNAADNYKMKLDEKFNKIQNKRKYFNTNLVKNSNSFL
jgi:import inner membrane translocase subunit TIM50